MCAECVPDFFVLCVYLYVFLVQRKPETERVIDPAAETVRFHVFFSFLT